MLLLPPIYLPLLILAMPKFGNYLLDISQGYAMLSLQNEKRDEGDKYLGSIFRELRAGATQWSSRVKSTLERMRRVETGASVSGPG